MDKREYRTVVLAGLLHDVGKLLQRGDSTLVQGQHPELSASFVQAYAAQFDRCCDATLLKVLVQHHHESSTFPPELRVQSVTDPHAQALAYIVSRADNLSSSERGERSGTWRDFRATRLALVFGRLSAPPVPGVDRAEKPQALYQQARPLAGVEDLGCIFGVPDARHGPGEVGQLIASFGQEFRELARVLDWDSFECVFTHLLSLLQRYAWALPSDTQDAVPDVSLFDHLKTTAAIAGCLYLYHDAARTLDVPGVTTDKAPRFRLAVGDVSGIQSYIFDIANVGVGGVAKRLRARSLFVQVVSEVASHRLLRALDLALASLLMSSGGKFYVLLPNTPDARLAVEALQAEADAWFLREMNGELALNLASVEFGDESFRPGAGAGEGFGGVLERLARALGRRKQERFRQALQDDGGWAEGRFVLRREFGGQGACPSCGKFPRSQDGFCPQCQRDTDLGASLPRVRCLAFYPDGSGDVRILGSSVTATGSPVEVRGHPYLVVCLNDARLGQAARHPATFRYVANHIPRNDEGAPVTFEELASHSQGRPMLGYLKVDVDRLGETFIFGLKREPPEASYDTISRLTALSRELDLFFSGWVERLTTQPAFGDAYTVFAGGDDLLLIGPWERMVDLGRQVEADFRRFTGHPGLTLSAGIALTKPGMPVARAAQRADELVKESKARGRRRLTLLGSTLPWTDVAEVLAQANEVDHADPPTAFLYSLLRYGEMWRRYRDRGEVQALRFQPLLAYNVARNVDPVRQPQLDRWARNLVGLRPDDSGQRFVLDYLALIASVCILRRRGR